MADRYDLILKGGTCVTPGGIAEADVGVRDGMIVARATQLTVHRYNNQLFGKLEF